jgi:hypothetical protein
MELDWGLSSCANVHVTRVRRSGYESIMESGSMMASEILYCIPLDLQHMSPIMGRGA